MMIRAGSDQPYRAWLKLALRLDLGAPLQTRGELDDADSSAAPCTRL